MMMIFHYFKPRTWVLFFFKRILALTSEKLFVFADTVEGNQILKIFLADVAATTAFSARSLDIYPGTYPELFVLTLKSPLSLYAYFLFLITLSFDMKLFVFFF